MPYLAFVIDIVVITSTLLLLPQELGVNMTHIESRPYNKNHGKQYDFFVDCECSESNRRPLIEKLNKCATSVSVLSRTPKKDEGEGGIGEGEGGTDGRKEGCMDRVNEGWMDEGREGGSEG